MDKFILYIDGKEVSLKDFLKITGHTEDMLEMLLLSGIPMKTMDGKKITYRLIN